MKRVILSILLGTYAIFGFSQKHIRLSFVGSPSVNWMVPGNSVADRGKATIGYDFGLNGDIYFSEDERYSLLTGLLITNTGGELNFRSNSDFQFSGVTLPPKSKIRYHLRYVEVPLVLKLKTVQFQRTRYWGEFGMTGMVNIESKGDSNNGALNKTNINDEINLFNIGMNIGLGFDFDLGGSNSVTTGLIFQNGLIDVTTDNAFTDKTIINSLKLKIGLIF